MTSPVSDEDRELARVEAATAWVHKRWERYEFKDADELVVMKALDVIEVADSPWMRAMVDALVENAYWGPRPMVTAQTLRGKLDQLWGWAKSGKDTYPGDAGEYYLMDIENVDGFTNGVLRILCECGIEVDE